MKTILTTILMMCLVTSLANSQTFKVTGGVNLMSLKTAFESTTTDTPTDSTPVDDNTDVAAKSTLVKREMVNNQLLLASTKNTSNESGFYLGLAISDFQLLENIELQPEVRFVAVKDFNQIQVPVLIKYNLSESFNAYAGPNFGYLFDVADTIKSFNFALDFGVSYNISNKIALDARYDWGQTNLLKNGDSNNYMKINNIQFGLVYRLGN